MIIEGFKWDDDDDDDDGDDDDKSKHLCKI